MATHVIKMEGKAHVGGREGRIVDASLELTCQDDGSTSIRYERYGETLSKEFAPVTKFVVAPDQLSLFLTKLDALRPPAPARVDHPATDAPHLGAAHRMPRGARA